MKLIRTMFLAVALAALMAAAAPAQDDMQTVANDVFTTPQRPPAVFLHDAHNETAGIDECGECHHVYEDGKRVPGDSSEDQRCSDCHGEAAEGRQPGLMSAFHQNCKGCHAQKGLGPLMCGECHRR